MIINDLKEVYIIKCNSDKEAKTIERLHENDMRICYEFFWALEYYGPQIDNGKVYFVYDVPKEILLATESICNKKSQIGSFIKHILYFQNLKES